MPWKGEKNPYKIWLSEVILQQTRVEQGWSYYEKFISNYPTIQQLAAAPDETVFKLWEGLGYYNRCKNLLFTARDIVQNRNGIFPSTYGEIVELKGIGPYTAAAISSFAFNLPHAVVDGNVFRVLSRLFGISTPIDSTAGKKEFTGLAQLVLSKEQPALYNQAIMDFGATVCKPALPLCNHCPLQQQCIAYKEGRVNALPVKEKVLQKKTRWFTYFILVAGDKVLVHKRGAKDIWENLFEFYLLESDDKIIWDKATAQTWLHEQFGKNATAVNHISPLLAQQLTHQTIKAWFIAATLAKVPANLQHYTWHPVKNLPVLAFPKVINTYLQTGAFQQSLF
ncbi:A/G-specific adenine glycosylase [Deminuibacter soli]|uniref:Adenine DNA glycosylase n=2 Tax=Deminuibacter soli TaxID=2291815 RepID=A0A3E1ND67_9BACT|nr:A/G-specific adenine glycosylase [Deminuibacter soli]